MMVPVSGPAPVPEGGSKWNAPAMRIVLISNDEKAVRMLLKAGLTGSGRTCLEAGSAEGVGGIEGP